MEGVIVTFQTQGDRVLVELQPSSVSEAAASPKRSSEKLPGERIQPGQAFLSDKDLVEWIISQPGYRLQPAQLGTQDCLWSWGPQLCR